MTSLKASSFAASATSTSASACDVDRRAAAWRSEEACSRAFCWVDRVLICAKESVDLSC